MRVRFATVPVAPSVPASGDGLDIPEFLLVKNRLPLTPEQHEKLRAQLASVDALPETPDYRKPMGMSAEEWAAHEARRAEERKIKARNRIAKMLAKKAPRSLDRHPRTDGKRRVCWQGEPMWQGTVITEGERPVVRWDNGNEIEVEGAWIAPIPLGDAAGRPVGSDPGTPGRVRRSSRPGGESRAPASDRYEALRTLMTRPQGCTTAEALQVLGWPAVSMPAMARRLGLELKKEKAEGVTRYRGDPCGP
ncbi:hypothetical protein K8I85_07070 [bacterium]|nr:hypothetical protein [bacterium]